jgi:hypothetical protein
MATFPSDRKILEWDVKQYTSLQKLEQSFHDRETWREVVRGPQKEKWTYIIMLN